jgi:hypothetical protein
VSDNLKSNNRFDWWRQAIAPPPPEPCTEWIVKHCKSPKTSAIPGDISFDMFPCSRLLINDVFQNPLNRKCTVIAAAQTIKTQNVIWYVNWRAENKPTDCIWAMATSEQCEEFANKRLHPNFLEYDNYNDLVIEWNKFVVMLSTMNIFLRGSVSTAKLQSTPVGLIICDERHSWKEGAILHLRERMTTFHDSQELSFCTGGKYGDDTWTDFKEGSQSFFHWTCPKCGHSQPFRFGRDITPMWPEARQYGGFVSELGCRLEDDPVCKDQKTGEWNEQAVKQRVRYQCENEKCQWLFKDIDKYELLKSIHWFHRRPSKFPEEASIHCNQFYSTWYPKCEWGNLVWRFILAVDAVKFGDIEPLKEVITQVGGEPW